MQPQPARLLAPGSVRGFPEPAAQGRSLHLGRGSDAPAAAWRHSRVEPHRLAATQGAFPARARLDSQSLRLLRGSLGCARGLSRQRSFYGRLECSRGQSPGCVGSFPVRASALPQAAHRRGWLLRFRDEPSRADAGARAALSLLFRHRRERFCPRPARRHPRDHCARRQKNRAWHEGRDPGAVFREMSLLEFTLLAFGSLFVIVDPIAVVPGFLAITPSDTPEQRERMARMASFVMAGVLLAFALLGKWIFQFTGITLPAFQIAGSIILMLVALDMLRAQRSRVQETREETEAGAQKMDVAITPLAIPMLSGPGAISTVILLHNQ